MMKQLFKTTDSAIFIYFRFFAGVFLACELINSINLGDLKEYSAPFHFNYLFLDWIRPWQGKGMVVHFLITILAGFTMALGIHQRLSAVILFLGYSSLFLMEKSEYVNHFYLYCLIAFWCIFLPVKREGKMAAPAWLYYLLLFHISIVYFYAGVAKLNPDWLSLQTIEAFYGEIPHRLKIIFAYGGLGFDLLIVPLLLWRRTRAIAFVCAVIFHLTNVYTFGLATFPWFSIMMTTLFFGVSWPRKFSWFDDFFPETGEAHYAQNQRWVLGTFLCLYGAIQLLLPLRQHLYSGNTAWTEEGHMFSWRMKLRTKTGDTIFYIVHPDKKVTIHFPQRHLTHKQYRDMIGKPDSILQYAQHLKKQHGNVQVYASAMVSLNGKRARPFIDQKVDLAREERSLAPYDWVMPAPSSPLWSRAIGDLHAW